jgi:hypothetical protein
MEWPWSEVVALGDRSAVVRLGPLDQPGIDTGDIAVQRNHLLPAFSLGVQITVVRGNQPRLMGIERLDGQKERVGILVLLQPGRGFAQHAR